MCGYGHGYGYGHGHETRNMDKEKRMPECRCRKRVPFVLGISLSIRYLKRHFPKGLQNPLRDVTVEGSPRVCKRISQHVFTTTEQFAFSPQSMLMLIKNKKGTENFLKPSEVPL
jgi:hypothetical protein